jgi:Family of unknown function (DUF6056)
VNPTDSAPGETAEVDAPDSGPQALSHGLRAAQIWSAIVATVAVVPYFVLAWFTHPGTDDFCHAFSVAEDGFLGSQLFWYREWSGRFTATGVFASWGAVAGLAGYPAVGLSALAGLFSSTWALVRALGSDGRWRQALVLALPLYAVLVITMPVPNQTVYWLAGASAYQLGNILFVGLLATLLGSSEERRHGVLEMALVALGGLATVGCNETILPVAVVTLGVGVAVTAWYRLWQLRAWIAAWCGALLGSAVVLLSPGNASRSASYPEAHRWTLTVVEALSGGLSYFGDRLFSITAVSAALLAMPWARVLARRYDTALGGESLAMRWWLAGGWVLLFPILFAPAWWSLGEAPPDRALSVAHVVFVFGGLAIFLPALAVLPGLPSGWPRRWLRGAAAVALAVGLGQEGHFALAAGDLASGKALRYHRDQMQRRRQVEAYRLAGVERPLVAPVASSAALSISTVDIGPDAADWINECYANFFGFRSIALGETEAPGR